jgi:hypothetical protein|tara:strand:+ start:157 stop:678 length:522 start_codon:yes stop_codon:yes gene_type:complete
VDLELIKKEIENWIFDYLDVPSAFYNGNKPCPFAVKAWRDQQVKIVMGDKATVRQQVYRWNDDYKLVVVVYDPALWKNPEPWAERYNERIVDKDLYVMVFDPDDDEPNDPNLTCDLYEQVVDYEYGMVFIQRLEELNNFSMFLESQNYYGNCSDDFIEYVNKRRSYNAGKKKG